MRRIKPIHMAVPGMHMAREERSLLQTLARDAERDFEKPVILNIGVAAKYGFCSMRCLRAGSPRAELIGIDIQNQGATPSDLGTARIIIGDSGKLAKTLDIKPHLAFIDGDHTEEGLAGDIEGWLPKIAMEGIVAFHDYNRRGPGFEHVTGVTKAIDRLVIPDPKWTRIGLVSSTIVFTRIA